MSVDTSSWHQAGSSHQLNPAQPAIKGEHTSGHASSSGTGSVLTGRSGASISDAKGELLDSTLTAKGVRDTQASPGQASPTEVHVAAAEAAGEAEAEAEASALKEHMGRGSKTETLAAGLSAVAADTVANTMTIPLAELQNVHRGEMDIDFAHKEKYLNDTDFHNIFGMDRTQFAALPVWKQQALKKQHKLF